MAWTSGAVAPYTGHATGVTGIPEYWRLVYGGGEVQWVPPVVGYNFEENIPLRGRTDLTFRWDEVTIKLEEVGHDWLLDFIVPDSYLIEITPDIGWPNILGMFGEDEDLQLNNPHLQTLGPFSISAGNLTDNMDGTVTAEVAPNQFDRALIDGYRKYLWRAVPFANGVGGLGGLPQKFDYISTVADMSFTVDDIVRETRKPIQVISGTKGPRVSITTQDDNNPVLFIETTETTWRINYTIDRPQVKFKIKATDSSGSAIGFHQVDIEYESFGQFDGHVWNTFDGFGLLASMNRLPDEVNSSFRERIIDAFTAKGTSDYAGLVAGINRELGLTRYTDAISIVRDNNGQTSPSEPTVEVEVLHTRLGIKANSFVIHDETHKIDSYFNSIDLSKRISEIQRIATIQGIDINPRMYKIDTRESTGKRLIFDPSVTGIVSVHYIYIDDITFSDNPLIGDVVASLNSVSTPAGNGVLVATLSAKLSGSERSDSIMKTRRILNKETPIAELGWSAVGLFAIPDQEWKQSFRDNESLYFSSKFYRYILELKSQTNIEWGHIVADKDIWDAVDSTQYGRESLPIATDIKLSHYTVPIDLAQLTFDPWESFRMGYYFDGILIRNVGYPKQAFRSGVGFTKDCAVGVTFINISSAESIVNQSPIVQSPADVFEQDVDAINDIILDF